MTFDKIIIGAGLYGLYSAELCGKHGESVLVIECDNEPFGRATFANQARIHHGYHYPRSLSTALKSAGYFKRFNEEFGFCINQEFEKIYGTSWEYSWSSAEQFKSFCTAAGIPCTEMHPERFFKDRKCDGAFLTQEYTYDTAILKDFFLEKLKAMKNVRLMFNTRITGIERKNDKYEVTTEEGKQFCTGYVLNATYASTNQITKMLGYEPFKVKYELCEVIICRPNSALENYGFTVMDGPFFSIMPFGKTGYHTLTSVTFTPHSTSYEEVPTFQCQQDAGIYCTKERLGNCNSCPAKPQTAFPYMKNLAQKYLKDEFQFEYIDSLFSMKPILTSSELDDSRPTVIRTFSKNPTFVSVLSGKINTVYDLDGVLLNE